MHIHECICTRPHMHKCVQEGFDDALIHLYYMHIWTHGYPVLGCWWHECICTHKNMPCIPRHKWGDYRNHTLINTCMFAYNHWQRDNHKHTHTHTCTSSQQENNVQKALRTMRHVSHQTVVAQICMLRNGAHKDGNICINKYLYVSMHGSANK